jgi:hypothetical protein
MLRQRALSKAEERLSGSASAVSFHRSQKSPPWDLPCQPYLIVPAVLSVSAVLPYQSRLAAPAVLPYLTVPAVPDRTSRACHTSRAWP